MGDDYIPIVNAESQALGLRLEVAGSLISFYRLDNGEKLLIPVELQQRAQQLESKVESLQAQLDRYRDRFGEL